MSTYQGSNNQSYTTIEPPLGKGGEGSVYTIQGKPSLVAKVFTAGFRTETKKRKLLAMLSKPMSSQTVAWPQDVIFENGTFVGYTMRKLDKPKDLNEVYDPSGQLKSLGLRNRVLIAQNLCASIYTVHQAGQVCGDLNPKNIQVEPDFRVTLVDTDSYHFTGENSRLFKCNVGREEYLPVEIQTKMKNGYTLDTAPQPTFSQESDLFALAIHIFALVMNGCHPFSTAVSNIAIKRNPSVTNPQPQENIASGSTPFFVTKSGLTVPTYAPQITALPQVIQDLFQKAFCGGHLNPKARPSSKEWYDALGQWLRTIPAAAPALAPNTVAGRAASPVQAFQFPAPASYQPVPTSSYTTPSYHQQASSSYRNTASSSNNVGKIVAIIIGTIAVLAAIVLGIIAATGGFSAVTHTVYSWQLSEEEEGVGGWNSHPHIFDSPVEHCTGFTLGHIITSSEPVDFIDELVHTDFDVYVYEVTADDTGEWAKVWTFTSGGENELVHANVSFSERDISKVLTVPVRTGVGKSGSTFYSTTKINEIETSNPTDDVAYAYRSANDKELVGGWNSNSNDFDTPIMHCKGVTLTHIISGTEPDDIISEFVRGKFDVYVYEIYEEGSDSLATGEWVKVRTFRAGDVDEEKTISISFRKRTISKVMVVPADSVEGLETLYTSFEIQSVKTKYHTMRVVEIDLT
ncbi:MAG: hypothetical protein FWH55_12600 [Oscillospiraceae bacterium]|nr:hypothetical protein [Oscillospiraceae bacterium]